VRLVLQRVTSATVSVGGEAVGAIARGILVLVGIEKTDRRAEVATALRKLVGLRLFADANGRMNLDSAAAGGEFLVVSQFTLLAELDRGRRPSFERAAPPAQAEPLVDALAAGLAAAGFRVATGRFGAHMEVSLVNDGPVTLVLDIAPEAAG